MQNPEKYREYAEECRRIAQQLPAEKKLILLEIANAWIKCAEEEERKTLERARNHNPDDGPKAA